MNDQKAFHLTLSYSIKGPLQSIKQIVQNIWVNTFVCV